MSKSSLKLLTAGFIAAGLMLKRYAFFDISALTENKLFPIVQNGFDVGFFFWILVWWTLTMDQVGLSGVLQQQCIQLVANGEKGQKFNLFSVYIGIGCIMAPVTQ
jgi:hypothetical protein